MRIYWRVVVLQAMAGLFWLCWVALDGGRAAGERGASALMVIGFSTVFFVIGRALEAEAAIPPATPREGGGGARRPLLLRGGVKPIS